MGFTDDSDEARKYSRMKALVTDEVKRFFKPEFINRMTLSIERFAGEVPPRFVNETPWGLIRNVELLRLLDQRLEERDTWQGRLL